MAYKPIPGVKVIGFGHKARNGKDTAASVLQDHFGSAARRVAYGDALKAVCRACYGMTTKDGPLLQMIGTDVYRRMSPDIWTDVMYYTIDELRPQVLLIPDVRFPNEAQLVKDMGGIMIRCIRLVDTPNGKMQYIDPSRPATHTSEIALDDYAEWDYTIVTDNVPELHARTLDIVRGLKWL